MTSLAERLRRLDRSPAAERPAVSPELRLRLDRVLGAPRPAVPPPPAASRTGDSRLVDRVVPGRRAATPAGPVYVADWLAPAGQNHGRFAVARLARVPSPVRALFPDLLAGVDDPGDLAFLDTETTGLAGGTGTVAFLVGVGRWRAGRDGFEVVQLFLEDLDREAALLDELARLLGGVRCLVTYNGARYDLPLLQTRCALHRRPWPLEAVPHLDLLPPARALWRHGHPDCRLVTLEAGVLGFQRTGDVPGAEIPAVYRSFLARGADERIGRVFHHNRLDLLSLAGLLWAAGDAARGTDPRAAVGAGLLHARAGRADAAVAALEQGLRAPLPRARRLRALRELAAAYKAGAAWGRAVAAWDELHRLDPADPRPVEEAAKALEHRLGDPAGALARVTRALEDAPLSPRDRERLERRRRRLAGKGGRG